MFFYIGRNYQKLNPRIPIIIRKEIERGKRACVPILYHLTTRAVLGCWAATDDAAVVQNLHLAVMSGGGGVEAGVDDEVLGGCVLEEVQQCQGDQEYGGYELQHPSEIEIRRDRHAPISLYIPAATPSYAHHTHANECI